MSENVKFGGSFTPVDAESTKRNLGKESSRIHTPFPISHFRSLGAVLRTICYRHNKPDWLKSSTGQPFVSVLP